MRRLLTLVSLALVLVAAAPAAAARPKPGTYKGKTSQGLSVTIKVNQAKKVKSIKFVVKNDSGATKKPIEVNGPFPVKETGRFSASLSNSYGTLKFGGRFGQKGKVRGRVRECTQDPLLGNCDTGKVTFTATRR